VTGFIWNNPRLIERRKALRNRCTNAESLLWKRMQRSQLGVKFRRQHSVGNYVLDFYCPEFKLAIELDGSIHKGREELDEYRTRTLNERGIKIIRFKNNEVENNIEEVIKQITTYLNPPS
jgi:very-short-patch-repair endonuclease